MQDVSPESPALAGKQFVLSLKLHKTQLSSLGAFPTPAGEIPQAAEHFRKRVWNFLTSQPLLEHPRVEVRRFQQRKQ